jgi:hypothetical protein
VRPPLLVSTCLRLSSSPRASSSPRLLSSCVCASPFFLFTMCLSALFPSSCTRLLSWWHWGSFGPCVCARAGSACATRGACYRCVCVCVCVYFAYALASSLP